MKAVRIKGIKVPQIIHSGFVEWTSCPSGIESLPAADLEKTKPQRNSVKSVCDSS